MQLHASTGPVSVPLIDRLRDATRGAYDVLAVLGEGGMATVFLARDLRLDRQVAIKVMHPALMASAMALSRFQREARVAAALDHPNIINIYSVGEHPELAFYVMRYLEGRTLQRLIADEGPFTPRRAAEIIGAVGRALHYGHSRGVIHRDVKPANVMVLDNEEWVVVTDFGIAKAERDEELTLSGHVVGTPNYICPEYFDHGEFSAASDQYALGVVAFELFAGAVPFEGDTLGEVIRGHLLDPIPRLSDRRADLPLALDDVLTRMLAKQPADRFANCLDAVAALRAAIESGASTETATEIIRTPDSFPLRGITPAELRVRAQRRHWWVRGGIAAAAVASVAISMQAFGGAPEVQESPVTQPTTPITAPETQSADAPPPTEGNGSTPTDHRAATDLRNASLSDGGAPPVAPRPAPTTGSIRIGSRVPLAALYVGNSPPRMIGEQGVQTLTLPVGDVRLSIRVDGCASWDTTVSVRPGATETIGYRAPRC